MAKEHKRDKRRKKYTSPVIKKLAEIRPEVWFAIRYVFLVIRVVHEILNRY